MSLMTQALKQLAHKSAQEPERDEPTVCQEDCAQKEPFEALESLAIEAEAPSETFEAISVSQATAKLRDAVLRDVAQATLNSEIGNVILLISIQADRDTTSTVADLSRSLVGKFPIEVLAIDAALPEENDYATSPAEREHGFTSLIDGTRKLEDAVSPTQSQGLVFISSGLTKGKDQVFDPVAIGEFMRDCRRRYPFTVVDGGRWDGAALRSIAAHADVRYFVVHSHVTEEAVARKAVRHFDRLGVQIHGCIVAQNHD